MVRETDASSVRGLAADQAGVVGRGQLLALGLTQQSIRTQVVSGRWARVWPGVYATFTGPLPPISRVWAAVLHAGAGAVVAGAAALWLAGASDELPPTIAIAVPHGRRVAAMPGVRIRGRRHLADVRLPAARPPRLPIEEALLDEVSRLGSAGQVIGLVLQTIQRRSTTPGRLRAALGARSRQRWRPLLTEMLEADRAGVHSVLEHRYLRDVEVPHGLPRGRRNEAEATPGGTRYRDVRYRRWKVVVELDGALAHPERLRWRDRWRDNESVLEQDVVLRYGWQEIAVLPCATAGQVATALRRAGWTGTPLRCGPTCTL